MKKVRFWLGLVLGVLAFWICLKDVSWKEVWISWLQVDALPVLAAVFLLLVSYVFRAIRWTLLAQSFTRLTFQESFAMNAVGFLLIHVLPFRLGEFARPYFLKSRHGVSMSSGTAVVMIERVFDGLACTLALFIGLISLSDPMVNMEGWEFGLTTLAWTSFSIFMPVLILLVIAMVNGDWLSRASMAVIGMLPSSLQAGASRIVHGFLSGLRCLPGLDKFLKMAVETLALWGVMPLFYALMLRAFHIELEWQASFTIMGIAALGVMVPGPPGFIGTFQLFVQAALSIYGVSKSTGFAYAMLVYTVNMAFVALIGVYYMRRMSRSLHAIVEDLSEEAT